MAGFGDNTGGAGLQRAGSLPNGGLLMEAGCWTKADATNLVIPSQFNQVVSLIVSDATVSVINAPVISANGSICASTSGTPIGEVINYVAFGY